MAEIRQSKTDMEDKIASSIADLKCEVATAQEKTSRDFLQRMATSAYQFKKGHEWQYGSNAELQDAFSSIKTELDHLATTLDDPGLLQRAQTRWMKVWRH